VPLNFGTIHTKKEGLHKDGAIHGETLCLTEGASSLPMKAEALDLSKMALCTMCMCARINTDLSKMVLCTGCGCAHRHRLCQRWLIGTWDWVCVWEREREHTNMDLKTVIANELTHHGV
jgi:hypothetical protein